MEMVRRSTSGINVDNVSEGHGKIYVHGKNNLK